ncbi:hypothetical protein GCM10011374_41160 [Kocuria dechangensis]|uniref:Uncharacterized protein n=1 Tax=Kocuria dechangensis TaxID=1176249 RepID=A0A917HAB4_9MICC|nr:hypothetical protein [Kocuria dechangensis]GGG72165.1 hypothetical protein GCM10011374_41160 [Kocuria dechangensis]
MGGGYDVVTHGESITEDVITSLVAAVADAVAGQPGQVRRVGTTTVATTTATPAQPTPAQPNPASPGTTASATPSRLGTLTTRPRFDNAVFFTWQLDYGDKLNLALLDSGRYLGKNTAKGGVRFIRTTHFHTLPQQQWPTALEAAVEPLIEAQLAPVSLFPWGQRFFTGPWGEHVLVPSPFTLGGQEIIIDTELPGPDHWTPTTVSAGDTELIELHPEAAHTGWLIAEVQHRPLRGPHRYKTRMACTGPRTGHWA